MPGQPVFPIWPLFRRRASSTLHFQHAPAASSSMDHADFSLFDPHPELQQNAVSSFNWQPPLLNVLLSENPATSISPATDLQPFCLLHQRRRRQISWSLQLCSSQISAASKGICNQRPNQSVLSVISVMGKAMTLPHGSKQIQSAQIFYICNLLLSASNGHCGNVLATDFFLDITKRLNISHLCLTTETSSLSCYSGDSNSHLHSAFSATNEPVGTPMANHLLQIFFFLNITERIKSLKSPLLLCVPTSKPREIAPPNQEK